LAIGAVGAALVRALVPVQMQPFQRSQDVILGLAGTAHLVGVLDAQDELATVLAGKAQIEEGNVGSADVGVAGRRWRDARTDGGHGRFRPWKRPRLYASARSGSGSVETDPATQLLGAALLLLAFQTPLHRTARRLGGDPRLACATGVRTRACRRSSASCRFNSRV